MANVEIDADALIRNLTAAITLAVQDSLVKPEKTVREVVEKAVNDKLKEDPTYFDTPKMKKDRSKKVKNTIIEVGDLKETVNEVLNYQPEVKKIDRGFITSAKKVDQDNPVKTLSGATPVDRFERKIKFIDDKAVPRDKGKYPDPEPTTRAPRELVKFNCSICNRSFSGYYSEYPQALMSFREPSAGIYTDNEKPLVRCNECQGASR